MEYSEDIRRRTVAAAVELPYKGDQKLKHLWLMTREGRYKKVLSKVEYLHVAHACRRYPLPASRISFTASLDSLHVLCPF